MTFVKRVQPQDQNAIIRQTENLMSCILKSKLERLRIPAEIRTAYSTSAGCMVSTIVWYNGRSGKYTESCVSFSQLHLVLENWVTETQKAYDKYLFNKQWNEQHTGITRDNAYVMTYYFVGQPKDYDRDYSFNSLGEDWLFTTCIHDDHGNLVPVSPWANHEHQGTADQLDYGIAFYYGLSPHGQMLKYDQLA